MSKQQTRIQDWLNRSFSCECGQSHTVPVQRAALGEDAFDQAAEYCGTRGFRHILLVADAHTYQAAGEAVKTRLERSGITVDGCILKPGGPHGEIAADERQIVQTLLRFRPSMQAIAAVGSGTIHDVVRFVCSKTGSAFLSFPTAASVDGYISSGAPLLLEGFKQTIPAAIPEALFADPRVLAAAPYRLTAAGFGDLLGKFTSLADWRLGQLLFGEPFCPAAERLTRQALEACVADREAIADREPQAVMRLLEALLLSGISMLLTGNSRPASGAEHHLSHYWEMKKLEAGEPAVLHGAKVGAACALIAERYERIGSLTAGELAERLRARPDGPLTAEAAAAQIRGAYGAIADSVLVENGLTVSDGKVEGTPAGRVSDEQLLANWEAVRTLCQSVPAGDRIKQYLRDAGAPVTPDELHISERMVEEALDNAIYVRSRYTALRLYHRIF